MPARDINFGDVTVHFHFQYMSEHSDAEYETLRKAFLQLGEGYDKLSSENESLTMQKISDQKQQKWRDTFMTKKYKVGDTIYAKGKINDIDSGDDYLPYKVKFDGKDIGTWLSEDSFVEPPDKPTLPKAVADEIEDYKLKGFDLIDYFSSFTECAGDVKNSSKYMCDNTDKVNNQRVANLAYAWNNGYTVEKPKLYNLILSDGCNGQFACLFKPTRFDELWSDSETSDINLKHNKKYQFTQEEIDEWNKSFWIKNLDLNDYKVEVPIDEG